jgi:glycerol-3-phosphate responsive antiterminator
MENRDEMHLKEMGVGIWKAAIGGSVSLKNKSKFATERRMMHCLSRPFLVDSQAISKRAWDNALPPRIYG